MACFVSRIATITLPWQRMSNQKSHESVAGGGGAVCLVAPFPPLIGGMSVQAAKLATLLLREGIITVSVPVNPQPPRMLSFVNGVPAVRTLVREVQYLASLMKILPKATVVH